MSTREKIIPLEDEAVNDESVKDDANDGVKVEAKDEAEVEAEVKTIESICEENLVQIFSYLNAKDVKSAALVCKNWNEAIGSSEVTMRKFKLTIDHRKELDFDYSGAGTNVCSTRKHHNLKIRLDSKHVKRVKTTLSFFNISHAKSAEIIWNSEKLLTFALRKMPQLENLFIHRLDVSEGAGSMVTLAKLKKIKIRTPLGHPYVSFLKYITAENVVEINAKHFRALDFTRDWIGNDLADFLRPCKKITAMKLNVSGWPRLFEAHKWSECEANKWKLTSISLVHNFGDHFDLVCDDRLKQFLIHHGPTLKSLSLGAKHSLPTDFFEEVFSHLKQLTSLKLKCDVDEVILRYLPGLEKLTVDRRSDISISNIARFNQKLTYLCIASTKVLARAAVKPLEEGLAFNNLKHLVVRNIKEVDGWMSVVRSSPNIEAVEISTYYDFCIDDDTIDVLLQRPTLRHLKLGTLGIARLRNFFNKINNNPGNLESLILCQIDLHNKRKIEFVFPDDPTEWNAAEQQMRFDEEFHVEPENFDVDVKPTIEDQSGSHLELLKESPRNIEDGL